MRSIHPFDVQRCAAARFRVLGAAIVGVAMAMPAFACDPDASPIFSCEAANGRKFIELCASLPITPDNGYLQYRFGSLDGNGQPKTTELVFPKTLTGSAQQFVGATFTRKGVYRQSVRFVSGDYSYSVFTSTRGSQLLDAGVEVKNRANGKITTVSCNEVPRFYIFDLKGTLACDPETAIGKACIE